MRVLRSRSASFAARRWRRRSSAGSSMSRGNGVGTIVRRRAHRRRMRHASRSPSPGTMWVRSVGCDSGPFRDFRLDFPAANRLVSCSRARGRACSVSPGRRFESCLGSSVGPLPQRYGSFVPDTARCAISSMPSQGNLGAPAPEDGNLTPLESSYVARGSGTPHGVIIR